MNRDSAFDIFTAIQYKVMEMDMDQLISVLNECLEIIYKIQNENPEFKNISMDLLYKGSCLLDKDAVQLFKTITELCSVNNNSTLLIECGQYGGIGPEDENQLVPQNVARAPVPAPAANGPFIAIPPDTNPISVLSASLANLDPTSQTAIAQAILTLANAEKLRAEADLVRAEVERANVLASSGRTNVQTDLLRANAKWDGIVESLSIFISFGAPGALLYYFQSALDRIAIGTLNVASQTVGTAGATVELSLRNAIPNVLTTAASTARYLKDYVYIPSIIKDVGKTLLKSEMSNYATESVIAEAVREKTYYAELTTKDSIIVGCIILYIALVTVLLIVSIIIGKMRKMNKIGFYLGVPGVASVYGTTTTGGIRRTRNKKRKGANRRTRKRRNSN